MTTGPGGFLREDDEWRERAACRSVNPEWFFPLPLDLETHAAARTVCDGCEVRAPCLSYALRTRSCGVWGGTSELERDVMLRLERVAEREIEEVAS